jgi:hypothetical protein
MAFSNLLAFISAAVRVAATVAVSGQWGLVQEGYVNSDVAAYHSHHVLLSDILASLLCR